MFIALTAVSSLALAHEIGVRLISLERRWQRAACGLLLASVLWLASAWMLAAVHLLRQNVVIARTIVFAAVAILLGIRRHRDGPQAAVESRGALWLVALLPLACWIGFVLWRSAVLPPVNHDALSYHLPKAIFYVRAGGYDPLPALDWRERNLPVNYEMLLADAIAGSGDDRRTEWIGTWFYLGFILTGVALADRWWRIGPAAAVAVALAGAGVPVALLHSGAHKNDLMTAFFMISALLWAGHWLTERDRGSLALTILSLAAAIGTKPQAMALAAALSPLILLPLWTERRGAARFARHVAILAIVSAVAFLILGGVVYLLNRGGNPEQSVVVYGDWANLWQGPYVLLAAPFARHPNLLHVPWESRPWFWERYELFFSDLGIPFALCAISLPLAIPFSRRGSRKEPLAVTAAAFATFAAMLPVSFAPHGMFDISLPRYVLFIAPVVFGWTIPLLLARARGLEAVVVAAAAFCFVYYAVDNALDDRFAPLDYVIWAHDHPGTHTPSIDHFHAAIVADALAAPRETIAIESAYAAWIYPAFGPDLHRPVILLADGANPAAIPDRAHFVVIDRAFDVIWRHPEFRDLSQWRDYQMHGIAGEEDLRLFHALADDRRFALVYRDAARNQAVFRRRR